MAAESRESRLGTLSASVGGPSLLGSVYRRKSCARRSDDTDARHSLAAQGTGREHPLRWLTSDSQGRQWRIRRAVARAIETRNKIPDCVAPRWNETKKETVLFAFVGERPKNETLLVALA
jgi:hypothetical protein